MKEIKEEISGLLSWYGEDCAIRGYSQDKNDKATAQLQALFDKRVEGIISELVKWFEEQNWEADCRQGAYTIPKVVLRSRLEALKSKIKEGGYV